MDASLEGNPYGFLNGLWHGIIAPIDLVGLLFRDDVSVLQKIIMDFGILLVLLLEVEAGVS